ncbi:MAG: tRNA-binding protein [Candidatus Obscuribacterales bacterium]|nr:tRNA-binding protein [Candidatus Obscuribacterales bacterium]
MTEEISFDDFLKLDIRTGTISRVETFEKARKPAYKLFIDFGELGLKSSSAQITTLYQPADLVGRQVIAVINFKPRKIADFLSQVLVLGVPGVDPDRDVVLLTPERAVENGIKIF